MNSAKVEHQTRYRLFYSVAFGLALVLCLCLLFVPRWQSNDDAGMSMVLHGYGLAAKAMPNLIYSNILWGYLLGMVPEVNGILGYSVATIATLVLCGIAMSYFSACIHGKSWFLPLVIILLLSRPILFPHFTINAGLLAVCAALGMRAYALLQNRAGLSVSFVLLILACLIRQNEAFLVLLVASPLVLSQKLISDRSFQVGVLIFIAVLVTAMAIDYMAYANEHWRAFDQLAQIIGPYVDYGAGVRLEARPDIYNHYGLSRNDIELVRNWFFVDAEIADPAVLKKMFSELGPLPGQPGSYENGYVAWSSLLEKPLLPVFAAGLCVLLCNFNCRLFCAWGIFLGSIFLLGFSGRAGTLHVYLPLLATLLLLPAQGFSCSEAGRNLSTTKKAEKSPAVVVSSASGFAAMWAQKLKPGLSSTRLAGLFSIAKGRAMFMLVSVFFALTSNFYILNAEQVTAVKEMRWTEKSVGTLRGAPVVNWGDYFSFQNAFPVLSSNRELRKLSIYSLGAFTLAPFSTTAKAEQEHRGMKTLLRSAAEIQILASDYQLNLLRIYCKERKWGELHIVALEAGGLPLRRVRCAK